MTKENLIQFLTWIDNHCIEHPDGWVLKCDTDEPPYVYSIHEIVDVYLESNNFSVCGSCGTIIQ